MATKRMQERKLKNEQTIGKRMGKKRMRQMVGQRKAKEGEQQDKENDDDDDDDDDGTDIPQPTRRLLLQM